MICVFEGNKEQIEKCKKAILIANGDFGVYVESLSINKIGLFKYKLELKANGSNENIKLFYDRVKTNYSILNGNILGLLSYL